MRTFAFRSDEAGSTNLDCTETSRAEERASVPQTMNLGFGPRRGPMPMRWREGGGGAGAGNSCVRLT